MKSLDKKLYKLSERLDLIEGQDVNAEVDRLSNKAYQDVLENNPMIYEKN